MYLWRFLLLLNMTRKDDSGTIIKTTTIIIKKSVPILKILTGAVLRFLIYNKQ